MGSIFGLILLILTLRVLWMPQVQLFDLILIAFGILVGLFLVYTISRLYMLRTVPVWNNPSTPVTFFLTSLLLGFNTLFCGLVSLGSVSGSPWFDDAISSVSIGIFILTTVQITVSVIAFLTLKLRGDIETKGAQMLGFTLHGLILGRWGVALLGLCILFVIQSYSLINFSWSLVPVFLIFISEVLGRFLFFWQYQRLGY